MHNRCEGRTLRLDVTFAASQEAASAADMMKLDAAILAGSEVFRIRNGPLIKKLMHDGFGGRPLLRRLSSTSHAVFRLADCPPAKPSDVALESSEGSCLFELNARRLEW
jgi:hypothetical protein